MRLLSQVFYQERQKTHFIHYQKKVYPLLQMKTFLKIVVCQKSLLYSQSLLLNSTTIKKFLLENRALSFPSSSLLLDSIFADKGVSQQFQDVNTVFSLLFVIKIIGILIKRSVRQYHGHIYKRISQYLGNFKGLDLSFKILGRISTIRQFFDQKLSNSND